MPSTIKFSNDCDRWQNIWLQRRQKNSMRYLSTKTHNFLISFINYRAILILLMINWDKFSNYLIPSLLSRMLKRFNTKFLTQFFIQTKLYKIGFITNDLCSFCKSQSESLNHLFFHCPYSKQFWDDLEIYWCSISGKKVRLSLQNVLLELSLKILTLYIYCGTIL